MANRPFDRDWDERNEENRNWSPGRRGREQERDQGERGFYGRENEGASFAEQGRYRQGFGQEGFGEPGWRNYRESSQYGGTERGWGGSGRGIGESRGFDERDFGERFGGEQGRQRYGGFEGGFGRREQGQYGGFERGRFAGRGPKNYRRSDERIADEINERLTLHPEIDATEIDVIVQNAEVTLRGNVDERHAKRLAEDIAESVFGVNDVHNEIRVRQGQGLWGSIKETFGGKEQEESQRKERRPESESQLTGAGKNR